MQAYASRDMYNRTSSLQKQQFLSTNIFPGKSGRELPNDINGPWHKTRNMAQNNFTKTHVAVSVNQPNFIQGSLMDISLQLWSQFSGIFNLLSSQSSQNISKLHMATSYVVTLTSPRHAAKQYQTNSHFVSMKTQKWQIS